MAEIRATKDTFTLSWSHYLVLMRIENSDERNFYEIECHNQNWSVRQLYLRLGLCTLSAQQRTAASQGEGMDRGV